MQHRTVAKKKIYIHIMVDVEPVSRASTYIEKE